MAEIDTPAFAEFLNRALVSFRQNLTRLATKPEDVMPWRVNGERWHLGEKGFPAGKKLRWDRALLPRMVDLVREIEPRIQIVWDARAAISLKVPGINRSWAQWRTKECYGLDCRFLGKPGQFNLARVEEFGISPTIVPGSRHGDLLRLVFQHAEHVHFARLKEVLTEHLSGFREQFGKG
jgi:excinuclease ABC subunit A